MSYIYKLGRADQGATLTEWKEQARAVLQCSGMTVLNGCGSGAELILPLTYSNYSLQSLWPIASNCTQLGMQSFLCYWQLSAQLSCASNEILSDLILPSILSITVNLEMHLADVSLFQGNRSHFAQVRLGLVL